jgi:hypothetical protein
MQLPSIDRNQSLRPASVDSVSAGANRVSPVAPVNPEVNPLVSVESKPGVVNLVNTEPKPKPTDLVYSNMADPAKRLPEEATSPRDWTIKRAEKEKVEDPPPKPMSQLLMDHLKMMWTAGASAVQIDQAENILKPKENLNPVPPPVDPAKLDLTYKPNKVNKFDKA